jgi:hypothetical protein
MSLGPLQVLVVNFDETNFSGEIEAEFRRLEEAGTLRVIDVLVLAKSDAGEIEVLRSTGDVTLADDTDDTRELSNDEWAVADAVAPGGAAAIAIVEHTWAIPLQGAIERAGGHSVVAEWANAEDLAAMGVQLTA